MRSLRNFFITYGISLVVFGLIAFFIWNKIGFDDNRQPPVDKESSNLPVSGIVEQVGEIIEAVTENDSDLSAVFCCYADNPKNSD